MKIVLIVCMIMMFAIVGCKKRTDTGEQSSSGAVSNGHEQETKVRWEIRLTNGAVFHSEDLEFTANQGGALEFHAEETHHKHYVRAWDSIEAVDKQ